MVPGVRDALILLLRDLEQAVPPQGMAHHALTYARYGSEEQGWEDRLALNVIAEGKFQTLFIDPGDFEKPREQLLEEIVAALPPDMVKR